MLLSFALCFKPSYFLAPLQYVMLRICCCSCPFVCGFVFCKERYNYGENLTGYRKGGGFFGRHFDTLMFRHFVKLSAGLLSVTIDRFVGLATLNLTVSLLRFEWQRKGVCSFVLIQKNPTCPKTK